MKAYLADSDNWIPHELAFSPTELSYTANITVIFHMNSYALPVPYRCPPSLLHSIIFYIISQSTFPLHRLWCQALGSLSSSGRVKRRLMLVVAGAVRWDVTLAYEVRALRTSTLLGMYILLSCIAFLGGPRVRAVLWLALMPNNSEDISTVML